MNDLLLFDDPWMLALTLLIPLSLWLHRKHGDAAIVFAPAALFSDKGLPRSWRTRLLPLPRVLNVLGLLLIVIALARPLERVQLPLQKEGIDILMCIDVSSSMEAKDMDPRRTRLEVAKAAAAQFVKGRPGDRIGLIPFARYPDLACPMTLDHRTIDEFLTRIEMVVPDSEEDLTGIGTAVARAGRLLRDSLAPSKVVILLTDGEENVATEDTPDEIDPLRAAAACKQLGVRVYTIVAGIGKRRRGGKWVNLDTTQVKQLAMATGGAFFEAKDSDSIRKVYRKIDELEKSEFEEPRYELKDRFLPFLLSALGLLLIGRLLRALGLEVSP